MENEQALKNFYRLGYTSKQELQVLSDLMEVGAPEDLLLLAHGVISRNKPRSKIRALEGTIYKWLEKGWDTPEAARAGLEAEGQLPDEWEQKAKAILGIRKRELTPTERNYLIRWKAFELPEDVLRLAYERTCINTGSMSYPYMNAVLSSWHERRLLTVEDITEAESNGRVRRRDEVERLERENRILRLKINELQEALIQEKEKVVQLLEARGDQRPETPK